jgi:alpha-1,2-mannosyltransferase
MHSRRHQLAILIAAAFFVPMAVLIAGRSTPPIDLAVYLRAGTMFRSGGGLYEQGWGSPLAVPLPYTYPPAWAAIVAAFSWMPPRLLSFASTALNMLLLLWAVSLSYHAFLERRPATRPVAIAGLALILGVTAPVASTFFVGQLGLVLMALCLADTVPQATRFPRGVLVGIATAVKLTPGIFILYWLVVRRWRAALTATVTAASVTLVTAAIRPDLARTYWTVDLFHPDRVGDPGFVSNQSLYGVLERTGWLSAPVWLLLASAALVVGMRRAVGAHRAGDELTAISLVGLLGLILSPISWIHHGVWIIPATGVLLGDGRSRPRTIAWIAVVCLFVLRLPVWAEGGDGDGVLGVATWVLQNSCVAAYCVLLLTLPIGEGEKAVSASSPAPPE